MDAGAIGRLPVSIQNNLLRNQATAPKTEGGQEPFDAYFRATPSELAPHKDDGLTPPSQEPAQEGSSPLKATPKRSGPSDDAESVKIRSKAVADRGDLESLKEKRKELRAKMKEIPKGSNLAQEAQLSRTLKETQNKLKGLERFKREKQWSGVAGENVAASPTYKNFFESGKISAGDMKEVVQISQELADPNSPRRLKGNKIEVLTRGEIWQKKMEMMESAAANPTQAGKPTQLDAEYFELSSPDAIEKLGRAARGGAKVRVLVDAGRLQPDGDKLDATSLAVRLNTVKGLEAGSRGQAGVQLFANQEVLGARTDLMHRKYLRVGDEVLFGGMNANSGSGENVDSAMTMQGPAATKQAQTYEKDIERSTGRSVEQIYGTQLKDLREKENVTVSPQGLLALLESTSGQGPKAGRSTQQRVESALESAAFKNINVADLVQLPDSNKDGKLNAEDAKAWLLKGEGSAVLTSQGRELLAGGLEEAVKRMNSSSNLERMKPGPAPSDKVVGTDTVAVGDTANERTAMMLHTIDSADKFVNVSAFVVSEEVARALVDKRDRMKAEGKNFEVRVILDPGIYGYGGTPNEKGYRYLEDHQIPVKWAVLDRSNPHHDRKVHAKLMVTDKMMLTGSTNFSSKALKDNWELSDVVYFGDNDQSRSQQQELNGDFDHLWNRESIAIDTKALAEKKFARSKSGAEKDLLMDRYRDRSVRTLLRGIENYEQAIGERVQGEIAHDPSLAFNLEQQVKSGKASGYALWDLLGEQRLSSLRQSTPAYSQLEKIAQFGPPDRPKSGASLR